MPVHNESGKVHDENVGGTQAIGICLLGEVLAIALVSELEGYGSFGLRTRNSTNAGGVLLKHRKRGYVEERSMIIESWGHVPEAVSMEREEDPWSDFDQELTRGIADGDFFVDLETGEVKRRDRSKP